MPLGFPADQINDRRGGRAGSRPHYLKVDGKEIWEPTVMADKAVRFIEEKSKDQKPWLYVLSWIPPHAPYAGPPEFTAHYKGNLQLAPNVPKGQPTDFARQSLPDYYGMVESLDVEFRRVLDAVDRAGVAEDTIVSTPPIMAT